MHLHRRQRHFPSTLAFHLLLLGGAGTVQAQTSADLTLVSAYTARGAALGNNPALQLRVEHDAESASLTGWYAGGFGSPVTIEGQAQGQLIAYAGRAQRLTSTVTFDAGLSRTVFTRDGAANYHEFYAGLALQRVSARVFYSPAYYGEGRTAYVDVNGGYPINDLLHVAVHAGLLHPFGAYQGAAGGGADVRVALGANVGDVSVEAGWQVKAHAYLDDARPARALTATASMKF